MQKNAVEKERNYQLDVLKLFFALLVAISHTDVFVGENTRITSAYLARLGWWSVYFFFIISGLLMVSHYMRYIYIYEPGKAALSYVTGKFKKKSIEYITTLMFVVIINLSIGKVPLILIPRTIPWLFAVEQTGIKSTMMENMPIWYISAMLISMLPLYYMLAKNKDFFTKVFAPLTGLVLYGYMFNHDPPYFGNWDFVGLCTTGVIRAIQGLCFGVIAYLIYEKLCVMNNRPPLRAALTVLESIMYIAMIYIIFDTDSDYYTVYSIMLLMPIAIAITFSQKSYISEIFKSKIFRKAGTLSLAIYLTHYSAMRIVQCLFSGKSYRESCLLYGLFIIPITILYFIIVHFIRKLWSEKVIPIFFRDCSH